MLDPEEGRQRAESVQASRQDLAEEYGAFADAAAPMAPVSGVTPSAAENFNRTGSSEDIDNAVLLEMYGEAPGGTD
jgi:hypothetical protein